MQKTILTTVLILCASLAQADLYETAQTDGTRSFSDSVKDTTQAQRHNAEITHPLKAGELPGIWEAKSLDGRKTELTLRSNGSFVFDQASDRTSHRVYMCGTWKGNENALGLTVKALKRQLENGDIEQADGTHQEQAPILSAQKDRFIVVIHGEKLVFDRAG